MSAVLRLFVSSTFSDMQRERLLLQQRVFPKIQALCHERGASFQVVDLRWGVNETSQYEQKTMEICLNEVTRCQQLSPRYNFLALLGERYGWQPNPSRIQQEDFESICATLSDEDRGILEDWYRLDTNALPAEYVLRSRPVELDWMPISQRIKHALRSGIEAAGWAIDDPRRADFFFSATHQEILQGVFQPPLRLPDPREHVYCFFREIEGLPRDSTLHPYLDRNPDDSVDEKAYEHLQRLKGELREYYQQTPGNQNRLLDYKAVWKEDPDTGLGSIDFDEDHFVEQALHHLTELLHPQLLELEELQEEEQERLTHREFRFQSSQNFVGRTQELQQLHASLQNETSRSHALLGRSGTGKSSLLARFVTELENSDETGVVVCRFLGITPDSIEVLSLLRSLGREILEHYESDMTLATEPEELLEQFPKLLGLATAEKPLVLVLDALDQLAASHEIHQLDWLPLDLPEHVNLFVSALPSFSEWLEEAHQMTLAPMPLEDGRTLLNLWLRSQGRQLQAPQEAAVLECFEENGLPLYLRLAFEQARLWHSQDGVPALGRNVEELLEQTFAGLEKEHTPALVKAGMSYLRAARHGLTESELLDVLSLDKPYFSDFQARSLHELPEQRLPVIVWSRLFLDLKAYLAERRADGKVTIDFFYRQFAEYVDKKYFTQEEKNHYHGVLATYFEAQPLFEDGDERQHPNLRKLSEQVYQQQQAQQWSAVSKSLTDFDYLMARCQAGQLYPLQEEYQQALDVLPDEHQATVQPWEQFYRTEVHLLAHGDAQWPSHRIFFQLAAESPEDHPLAQAADTYLKQGKVDWLWLRRAQRAATLSRGHSLRVFNAHRNWIVGAIQRNREQILSWSKDYTLCLWDVGTGKLLSRMRGHTASILNAILVDNGDRVLSWSKDNTLRLWDLRDGQEEVCFARHEKRVRGVLPVSSQRFLSWSEDNTLRLWDLRGEELTVFEGHRRAVVGAFWDEEKECVVSWSEDRSIRLWDLEGNEQKCLKEHTKEIVGARLLQDDSLLTWSKDHTLRRWNWREGESLQTFEGHENWVRGAIELRDGSLFSWSRDFTLRLWDKDSGQSVLCKGHKHEIAGATELSDGTLLSWSKDKTLRLWNLEGKSQGVLEGHYGRINGALELEEGKTLLSWAGDSTLRLWDLETKQSKGLFSGHKAEIFGAALLEGTEQFFSWSQDMTLRLWEQSHLLADSEDHPGHQKWIMGGRLAAPSVVGSWDNEGRLFLWNTETGTLHKELKGHTKNILRGYPTPDGRLLTWAEDATLRFWSWQNDEVEVHECDGRIGGGKKYDDGVLLWTHTGSVEFWNWSGERLFKGEHKGKALGARRLPDQRWISWSGTGDNSARLWSEQGELLQTFQHKKAVNGVLDLEDGRFVSWSTDKTLKLWSEDSTEPVVTFEGHKRKVGHAVLLEQDRLLSLSNDQTARIWDLEGNVLHVLEGHKRTDLTGALELGDGEFLAWSQRKKVYRWSLNSPRTPVETNWEQFKRTGEHSLWRQIMQRRTGKVLVDNADIAGSKQGGLLFLVDEEGETRQQIPWLQEGEWIAEQLEPEGRFCFRCNKDFVVLHLYLGDRQISLQQAHEWLGTRTSE